MNSPFATITARPIKTQTISFSAVFAGTLIALLIDGAFMFIAGGIGLFSFRLELGEMPSVLVLGGTAIYLVAAAIIAFSVGGYVAARLGRSEHKWDAGVYGVSSFALATLIASIFIMPTIMLNTSGAFATVGMMPNGKPTSQLIMDQLAQLRIVTDLKLLEGKAVTVFAPMQQEQREQTKETLEATQDVRRGAALTSFGIVGLLIIGAIASILGGRRSVKKVIDN